ncbi:MAG: OxaA precursor, partial [Patescibacteria group bacterium]
MNPLTLVYTEVLWRPLFNLLVGLTSFTPGHYMWVAIVLVTLVVRLILLPLSLKQALQTQRNQGKMASLQ